MCTIRLRFNTVHFCEKECSEFNLTPNNKALSYLRMRLFTLETNLSGERQCLNYENDHRHISLVHPICFVLAVSHCPDFYPADYLVDFVAVPNYWIHHRSSLQTDRSNIDTAFPVSKGVVVTTEALRH